MHRNATRGVSLEVKSQQDNVVHTQLDFIMIDFWLLTPLSAIFQLYHGDQF